MDTLDTVRDILKDLAISQDRTDAKLSALEEKIDRISDSRDERYLEDLYNALVPEPTPNEIANQFFCQAISAQPTLASIHYSSIYKNFTRSRSGVKDAYKIVSMNGKEIVIAEEHYHIVMTNDKDIAIIEVKYKADETDVERLVQRKYENFKKLYPEYRGFTHHLALASFNMDDEVKNTALRHGVMVLQRKGAVFETTVPEGTRAQQALP